MNVDKLVQDSLVSPDEFEGNDSLAKILGDGRPTDRGLASAYLSHYGCSLVYTASRGWSVWRSTHWSMVDESVIKGYVGDFLDLCHRSLALSAMSEQQKDAYRKKLNGSITSVNNTTASLKTMVALADENTWDWRIDYLPVLNGMIDLRTGDIEPHKPVNFNTYVAPVMYDPDAPYDHWDEFIRESLRCEATDEVVAFFQLCAGYTLTGHKGENKMFWVWGDTRTGKSTTMNMLRMIMGDTCITMPFSTLSRQRDGSDQNFDLARLDGSRAVIIDETPRNAYLNGEMVKSATGGGKMQTAFKGKQFFEVEPVAKFWCFTNYPPKGDPEDRALWESRLVVFNFPNSKLGNEDTSLEFTMKEPEYLSGVLNWCLAGARRWYEECLDERRMMTQPEYCVSMRKSLHEQQDVIGQWIGDELVIDDDETPEGKESWTATAKLTASYHQYVKDQIGENHNEVRDSTITQALVNRLGTRIKRKRKTIANLRPWGYQGIKLRSNEIGGQL